MHVGSDAGRQSEEENRVASFEVAAREGIPAPTDADRFLDAVFAASPALVVILDDCGRIVQYNPICEQLLRFESGRALGRQIWELLPLKLELSQTIVDQLRASRFPPRFESVVEGRDGERRVIDWSSTVIRGPNGSVQHVVSIGLDVTERRRLEESHSLLGDGCLDAQEAAHHAAAFNQAILDSLFVQVAVLGPAGQVISVNRAWQAFVRLASERSGAGTLDSSGDAQACCRDVFHGDSITQELLDGVCTVVKGKARHYTCHYSCELSGGEHWLWMQVTRLRDRKGAVVTQLDITDRQQAQEKVRHQASLIENIQDAIISMDGDFRIQSWNEAAEKMYGWPASAVVGRHVFDVFGDGYAPGQLRAIAESLMAHGHWEGELVQPIRGGREIPVFVAVSLLRDLHDRVVGIVALNHDISRRKEAEKDRDRLFQAVDRQRRQLEAISGRLRQLAQEVVTVQEEERHRISRELHDEAGQAMTVLKFKLELIGEELARHQHPELDNSLCRSHLDDAIRLSEETIRRLRTLAHDLRPAALEDLGLSVALEAYCHDFASRMPIHIEYHGVEPQTVPAGADIVLYRFLQEALTNVLKHAEASTVQVRLKTSENVMTLTVEDDGRGLDTDLTCTNSNGGIGILGMQERLDAIGGRLLIYSRPDEGTRVTARVPLEPANRLLDHAATE